MFVYHKPCCNLQVNDVSVLICTLTNQDHDHNYVYPFEQSSNIHSWD